MCFVLVGFNVAEDAFVGSFQSIVDYALLVHPDVAVRMRAAD